MPKTLPPASTLNQIRSATVQQEGENIANEFTEKEQ
jgi:hypothetical protein